MSFNPKAENALEQQDPRHSEALPFNDLHKILAEQQRQQRERSMNPFQKVFYSMFPDFGFSTVTFGFTAIMGVVYLLTLKAYHSSGDPKAELWQRDSWDCTLYDFQAKFTYAISKQGQLWRLITPMFLHNSAYHLLWNLILAWRIGFQLEKMVPSKLRFILLLILGGAGANLLSAVAGCEQISVGSSGAVFAMLGAEVLEFSLQYNHKYGF